MSDPSEDELDLSLLKKVKLTHGKLPGNTCTVELQGATIRSWTIMGNEMLFVSEKAELETEKKALRGGIPICFPQFGPGPMKQHGFARLVKWDMPAHPTVDPGTGDVMAEFILAPSDFTRAMWDYEFKATYKVILKDMCMASQLEVENTGDKEFNFTALLHTYLPIDAIGNATVSGLTGCTYTDKVDGGKEKVEEADLVTIAGNVDRVYQKVNSDVAIRDGGNAYILLKRSAQLPDVVVWNPWAEKAREMGDFGDEEYHHMICVEAGAVAKPVVLKPGETWRGMQGLNLELSSQKGRF